MKERSRNVVVDEGGGDRTEEAEKRRGGERKEERGEESRGEHAVWKLQLPDETHD